MANTEQKVQNAAADLIKHNTYSPELKKTKVSKNIIIIGNTMFCRNGSAQVLYSEVPNVCLLDFTVRGPVIFQRKKFKEEKNNRVALHGESSIGDRTKTNGKIYNMANKLI